MKNNLTLILIAVIVPVLLFFAASSASCRDNLMSLYALAREKDPVIGRAQARFDATRADEDIAFAQILPRADASAGISWIANTTINYQPGDFSGDYLGDNYGFIVRQPVFNIPVIYSLKASRASVRGADALLTGSRQDLIIRLADAYFNYLKARTDEKLYKDELDRLNKILQQAQAFLKSGAGDVIAVFEARARMDSAAADFVKATSRRKLATQHLENLVGREVSEIMDLCAYQPSGPDPGDMNWWIETMEQKLPLLVQAREILSQTEYQRKAAKAAHAPVVQVTGGYTVNKGSTFLPEVETRQWYVGLNLTLPLFSGGEMRARTRKAAALESEQASILRDTREQSMQKLKEAFLNLQYNTSLIDAFGQKKSSAEIKLKATRKGVAIGTRTSIELLDAEQEYLIALRDYSGALYDNALRLLQLKSAAGILEENDLVILNSMLAEAPASF